MAAGGRPPAARGGSKASRKAARRTEESEPAPTVLRLQVRQGGLRMGCIRNVEDQVTGL